MNVIRAFKNAFEKKEQRNWDHIYVFVDVHETILYPDYGENVKLKFYPYAKEVLYFLSKRKDILLGMYSCSHPDKIAKLLDFFSEQGIDFKLINENTMEKNTFYADFTKKPYFNVLLDDKAGFDGESDWKLIYDYFKEERKKILIEMMRKDEDDDLYGHDFSYPIIK